MFELQNYTYFRTQALEHFGIYSSKVVIHLIAEPTLSFHVSLVIAQLHTKVKEPSPQYCLLIAREEIFVGSITFPRALEQCEMKTSSSRI